MTSFPLWIFTSGVPVCRIRPHVFIQKSLAWNSTTPPSPGVTERGFLYLKKLPGEYHSDLKERVNNGWLLGTQTGSLRKFGFPQLLSHRRQLPDAQTGLCAYVSGVQREVWFGWGWRIHLSREVWSTREGTAPLAIWAVWRGCSIFLWGQGWQGELPYWNFLPDWVDFSCIIPPPTSNLPP